MLTMINTRFPTIAIQNHRKRRSMVMMKKEGADLNFTSNHGFPTSLQLDNFRINRRVFSSGFLSRRTLLRDSPKRCMEDIGIFAQMLQKDRIEMEQPESSHYISLSPNVDADMPPPQTADGLLDISELIERVTAGQYGTVFLDPIQGLGDLRSFQKSDLWALKKACRFSNTLFVIDEVTCGLGRTGRLWAHSESGVQPDLMVVDFGMEVGVAALLMNEHMRIDGNYFHTLFEEIEIIPERCMEATSVLMKVSCPYYLDDMKAIGTYFSKSLTKTIGQRNELEEIRAFGRILALELKSDHAQALATACKEGGLSVDITNPKTIRLMPPDTVTKQQLDQAAGIMKQAMAECY